MIPAPFQRAIPNLYELIASKRGARLRWRTADGESLCFKKYIGHSKRPDTICWVERTIRDLEELRANNGKTVQDIIKHAPQNLLIAKDDLVKTCRQNGVGRNLTAELLDELLDDDRLFEVPVPRAGKRPKVLISREPVTLQPGMMLDALTQNSQGHYTIPAPQPPEKAL